jgi:uncharacterized protein (TIGR02145 family)
MADNLSYATGGVGKCYDNVEANCGIYGRLYSWAAAADLDDGCNTQSCAVASKHRGICPDGWHLPSAAEWSVLVDFVGTAVGTQLKSKSGWSNDGNGTDYYGFDALPGGFGGGTGGPDAFDNAGVSGNWWSATEENATKATYRYTYHNYTNFQSSGSGKTDLFSVRCVKG